MIKYLLLAGLKEIRHNWGWFLVLGVFLIILGIVALGAVSLATITSVLMLGWLVFFSGMFEVFASFSARKWSGFFLHMLGGVLYAVVGLLLISHPVASAAGTTLLLAALFLTTGLFRVFSAAMLKYPDWGWAVFEGVVSVILGTSIWAQWQSASLWVIGTFVGINLVFRGWAWVMFAFSLQQLPQVIDVHDEEEAKEAVFD